MNSYNINFLINSNKLFKNIVYFDTISSTNDLAKQLLSEGEIGNENTIILADEQTKGRGKGESFFYSPKGDGVYMSAILVNANIDLRVISIAVSLAIFKVFDQLIKNGIKIKWPNDILINNKKACGILIESAMTWDCNAQPYVIIGIGINVNNDYFSDEISHLATSLKKESKMFIDRNIIVSSILKELDILLKKDLKTLISEYKKNLEDKSFEKILLADRSLADLFNNI